jgi:hypothetical protein
MDYGVQVRSPSLWDIHLNTQKKPIVRSVSSRELNRVDNAKKVTQSRFTKTDGRPKYQHASNVNQAKNKPFTSMGCTIVTSHNKTKFHLIGNQGCRRPQPIMGINMLLQNNKY